MSSAFTSFSHQVIDRTRDSVADWVLVSTVDSTNSLARRILRRRPEHAAKRATAVLAWSQREGRGRKGRSWLSRAGGGVWASLLLPDVAAGVISELPLLAGVSLADALQCHVDSRVQLKWPNDLVVGKRKIGGILIEASTRAHRSSAIVGFGVNYGASLPAVPDRETTSVVTESARPPDLSLLAVDLVEALLRAETRLPDTPALISSARRLLVHRQGECLEVDTSEGSFAGVFRGVSDEGLLVLEDADGIRTVSAGEILVHE